MKKSNRIGFIAIFLVWFALQMPDKIAAETKVIHVFVALCDNKYQGIVPVPKAIGNGQDPNNNLYWGCGYGIRTYFKKSKEWKLVQTDMGKDGRRLERLVFKHTDKNFYLVADAYDGQYIQDCTEDLLNSCSGIKKKTLQVAGKDIGLFGNAKMIVYIGHNGLMDFQLTDVFKNTDDQNRDCILLACFSKSYFSSYLKNANANPIIWTTGLMCPEAYTLHDALSGYVNNESTETIRNYAASAYNKYQKCGLKAARRLLVTGFDK